MPRPTSYCLGCDKFISLTRYRVLPKEHFAGNQGFPYDLHFPLCFTCKGKLELIVLNAELQEGNWDEPIKLEIPKYFHLLKDFIMRNYRRGKRK